MGEYAICSSLVFIRPLEIRPLFSSCEGVPSVPQRRSLRTPPPHRAPRTQVRRCGPGVRQRTERIGRERIGREGGEDPKEEGEDRETGGRSQDGESEDAERWQIGRCGANGAVANGRQLRRIPAFCILAHQDPRSQRTLRKSRGSTRSLNSPPPTYFRRSRLSRSGFAAFSSLVRMRTCGDGELPASWSSTCSGVLSVRPSKRGDECPSSLTVDDADESLNPGTVDVLAAELPSCKFTRRPCIPMLEEELF